MDEPADLSSQDRPGWHLLDKCVSTRNRKVEGSNPSSGSVCPGQWLSSKSSRIQRIRRWQPERLAALLRLQTASSGDCCRRAGGLTATRVLR